MSVEFDAIVESGTLKPIGQLPFPDQTRVHIVVSTIHAPPSELSSNIRDSAGILKWTGTPEELDELLSDENSILESP